MTGSLLFNRQHSSTAGYSNTEKVARRKLRRCSSADEHSSIEVTPDENQHKTSFFSKRDPIASEDDSGIEDSDQQNVNYVCSQSNNVKEQVPSISFGACEDEDAEETSTPTMSEIAEYPAQPIFPSIHDTRKLNVFFVDLL
jgi:hypothetical protein